MSDSESSTIGDVGWDSPQAGAAIGMSVGAGLATAIGGALVFFPGFMKSVPQTTVLGVSLALSAVMLYVSFIEIFVKSLEAIQATEGFTEAGATALTTVCFFAGMLVCVLLEVLVHRMSKHGGAKHDDIRPCRVGYCNTTPIPRDPFHPRDTRRRERISCSTGSTGVSMKIFLLATIAHAALASEATNATSDDAVVGWDHPNIPYAITISLGAGLATVIGGSFVLCPSVLEKFQQSKILGAALALSSGVMIYVSFIEIFGKSYDAISSTEGISEAGAAAITTTFFFTGMALCALLEYLVHRLGHHHSHDHDRPAKTNTSSTAEGITVEAPRVKDAAAPDGTLIGNDAEQGRLSQMGLMTALAIGIHNFPEGLATFIATIQDTALGASLGVAIAIHNIPEGLCVAMPIYYASGSKKKALLWCFLSGITEPIGGILGFAALQPAMTPVVFGVIFGIVGGMMVFIVCHELLPSAHRYMANDAATTSWLVAGMVIMALSLVLFVI